MAFFEILIVVGCWVSVFVLAYVLRWLWWVAKAIFKIENGRGNESIFPQTKNFDK